MSAKLPVDITTEEIIALDFRYSYTNSELYKDWQKLQNTILYKTGSQFKPGLKLCQHFFPNFWKIENSKGLSFEKCWQDRTLMKKIHEWGLNSMSSLWLSWIRRAVYLAGGLPNSSYYRPHFSKQIIEQFSKKKNGILFDPCAGWGGRMLGTVAAGWSYVACEPNRETYENLSKLIDFLDISNSVTLHNIPAEKFTYDQKVDIVLTSPPYFNLEIYTRDLDQSYHRYLEYETWNEKWFRPLMENSMSMLNENGLSCWNVMNFGKQDLVETVIDVHVKNNYRFLDRVGFTSPLANIRNLKNKDVTYIYQRI